MGNIFSFKKNRKFGECHFRDSFFQQVLPGLNPAIKSAIQSKEGSFKADYNITDEWEQVFENLQETSWLRFNPNSVQQYCKFRAIILVHISHVKFTSLMLINLSNNHIVNVEALAFLDMNQIHGIHLENNHITVDKAIAKAKWALLYSFTIQNNNLNQTHISRAYTRKIKYFYVDDHKNENSIQIQDPRVLAKKQSQNVLVVSFCSKKNTIYNKEVQYVLREKIRQKVIGWGTYDFNQSIIK